MAFVGLFLGGSPGALIASGQSVLNLQWQAENRQDTAGASFTVTGPGVSKTVPARADGRAEITVPVGTFTVSVTHKGAYLGDDPVQVVAESQKSYLVFFDGKVDQTERITALENGKLDKDATAVRATADGNGNNIPNTYATIDYVDRNISNLVKKIDNFVITNASVYHPGNIGIEAHWDVNYPGVRNMTATISFFRSPGPISTTISGEQLASGRADRTSRIYIRGIDSRQSIEYTEIKLSDGSVYTFNTPIAID